MPMTGKSLAFYLKYWDEMDSLYFTEEYDRIPASSSDEKKDTVQKVTKVGDRACEQAWQLLDKLARCIIACFTDTCEARIYPKRGTVMATWCCDVKVFPKGRKNSTQKPLWMGVMIERLAHKPVLVGYIGVDNRVKEERLAHILKGLVKERSSTFGLYAGTVAIGVIPIECDEAFEVNEAPLIDGLESAFRQIGKSTLDELFQLVKQ